MGIIVLTKKLSLALFCLVLLSLNAFAQTQSGTNGAESYGRALYFRLTGQPLSRHQADFARWEALIAQKDWPTLASRATDESSFLNVTVLQWANLYYSAGKSAHLPFDDALATLVGTVKDNRDARLLLSGDYLYAPIAPIGPNPTLRDNTVYSIVEQRGLSLKNTLRLISPQWPIDGYQGSAGLFTTRSFSGQNYNDGTNRRAVKAAMETFLCRPIDTWRVPNLTLVRIHRDVDRAPGGDARVFQQECRTCHATLDSFVGAFSHLDFIGTSFATTSGIRPKYLQHPEVYPEGYVTSDDSWINPLATTSDSSGASFGWRGATSGQGIRAFGQMLSQSQEYSRCLAKRVYSTVCLKEKELTDPVIEKLASDLESTDQYRLKDFFARTALDPSCIGE